LVQFTVILETATSASTPCLLPQAHAPPTPTIAFASPPPSAPTRVVRPTTMNPVFVVQQDARLAVATIATARTLNAQQHPSSRAPLPMVWSQVPSLVCVAQSHAVQSMD
jgi:hypothetical protein